MKTISQIFKSISPYHDSLKRNEWKSFARGVRSSRGNTCETCRRCNVETHVHHLFYEPDKQPWEYDHSDVMLLCAECHKQMHEHLKQFRKYVFRNLDPKSFRVLNGALAVGLSEYNPLEFCYAVAEMASSPRSVKAFLKSWIDGESKQSNEESSNAG